MERRDFLQGVLATCVAPIAAQVIPASASAREPVWSKGEYVYCDAQLLAKLWNQPVGEVKRKITDRVLNGSRAPLDTALTQARTQFSSEAAHLCDFYDHGYSYDDMEALGFLWKTEPYEAKEKVSRKLFYGQSDQIAQLIQKANDEMSVAAHQGADRADLDPLPHHTAYWSKGEYLYCDAKIIATHWKTSVGATKLKIEESVSRGEKGKIERALTEARNALTSRDARLLCSYDENGYTFDDMVALGELWKIDSWEAKGRVSEKLFAGQRDVVFKQVKTARSEAQRIHHEQRRHRQSLEGKRERQLHALNRHRFKKSSYTYCDAAVLGHLWGVSAQDAKLKVGSSLRRGDEAVIKQILPIARRKATPKASEVCYYSVGGYSYSDMEALTQAWGVGIDQVKARVSRKLVRGEVEAIDRTVKAAHRRRLMHR